MRELTNHRVNSANDILQVEAVDERSVDGANHLYQIVQDGTKAVCGGPAAPGFCVRLPFQNGPINEVGVNGITHEALLAILEDRLQGFQSGSFQCEENGYALFHLREAMRWLKRRTQKRIARGVEGTHQV